MKTKWLIINTIVFLLIKSSSCYEKRDIEFNVGYSYSTNSYGRFSLIPFLPLDNPLHRYSISVIKCLEIKSKYMAEIDIGYALRGKSTNLLILDDSLEFIDADAFSSRGRIEAFLSNGYKQNLNKNNEIDFIIGIGYSRDIFAKWDAKYWYKNLNNNPDSIRYKRVKHSRTDNHNRNDILLKLKMKYKHNFELLDFILSIQYLRGFIGRQKGLENIQYGYDIKLGIGC